MKEFQCYICGKEFDNIDSMSHHQYGVHSTEELKCKQCPKILLGKKNLAAHMDSHEESHGYKVVKQIGTPEHLKKNQQSITSFNSLRAGFCSPKDFTLRRKSSPHYSSPSPSPLSSPRSSHLYPLHLMF